MNYRSLALFVCVLAAHAQPNNGWPTARKFYPWDLITWQYCAYHYVFQGGQVVQTPEPNVFVFTTAIVQPSSGWHTHAGPTRPQAAVRSVSPGNGQTGADGCVNYTYKGPGYSGWYTFESSTSDQRYTPKGTNSYFGYYEHGVNGAERDLTAFFGQDYTMFEGLHDDTRHKDRSGFTGFSRFGTWESIGLMTRIASAYEHSPSVGGLKLDVIRGSLPDGGIADNEYPSSGPYLFGEWIARQAEVHMYGGEWDLANPRIQAGGDADHFALLYGIMSSVFKGCRLGTLNQNGTPLGTANIYNYWLNQDVVHIVCSAAPLGLQ
jgi:hypothetical protein